MRPNLDVLQGAVNLMLTEQGEVGTLDWVVNPETGAEEQSFVAHYTGPMLIRPQDTEGSVTVGSTEYPVSRYEVTLPANTAAAVDDLVRVTECPYDAALVGVELTLVDVPLDAWQVARFCVAERGP